MKFSKDFLLKLIWEKKWLLCCFYDSFKILSHLHGIAKLKVTWAKNRPTCMNLILTNSSRSFQDTCTVETKLSDFHKLVATILKLYFPRQKPDIQRGFGDFKRWCIKIGTWLWAIKTWWIYLTWNLSIY